MNLFIAYLEPLSKACLSTQVRNELKKYWPILGTELKVPEPLVPTPAPRTAAEVNHLSPQAFNSHINTSNYNIESIPTKYKVAIYNLGFLHVIVERPKRLKYELNPH